MYKCPVCRRNLPSHYASEVVFIRGEESYNICVMCIPLFKTIKDTSVCPKCKKKVVRGIVHKKCYETLLCESCSKINPDEGEICKKCKENGIVCFHCGKIHSLYKKDYIKKENPIDNTPIYFSESCWNEVCETLRRHSETNDNRFLPDNRRKGLYLGVELEVECKNNNVISAYLMNRKSGKTLLYKSDGSLNNGFEINSYPATLEYHSNNYMWEAYLEYLRELHCLSHNTRTCGIHVHLSKSFMNKAERTKLTMFIHSQRRRLAIFARRPGTGYSRFKKFLKSAKYQKEGCNTSHYDAINFRTETAEIRIFRGTLKYDTFMAILELCDAMARFSLKVKFKSLLNRNVSWKEFIAFITELKYKYLLPYLNEKNLLTHKDSLEYDRDETDNTDNSGLAPYEGNYDDDLRGNY